MMTSINWPILVLSCLAISAILLVVYQRKELNFHKLQQKELDDYATEVEAVYRQLRGIRHDYRNHLQVMEAFTKTDQLAELGQYIRQLTNELNQVDTIIRTGNTMIDALVNTKLTRAQEAGVALDATAIAPRELAIEDVDLAIIIGNLLNNAVEATTLQLSSKQTAPFIRLYIAPMKSNLYISVTNTMVKNPQARFMSLKGVNRQGYGLRRIDQTVEKNKGHVNRQWEDGVFVTEITLPLLNKAG